MSGRKSVRPRMDSRETPALAEYPCKDFSSRTTRNYLLLKKRRSKVKNPSRNSIRLKFVKKTSMPDHAERFRLIKCYSSSCPGPVKSPSNSIRSKSQKIYSLLIRPETILEIRKEATFFEVINNSIIYKFFKDFLNHWKNSNRTVKQDSSYILNSSSRMYESSGS